MAEDMGRTTAWANDASPAHGLRSDHRDCSVVRESVKGCSGSNKQSIHGGLRTTVLDVAGDRIANLLRQRHHCLTSPLP
jgi:hypothetical protein